MVISMLIAILYLTFKKDFHIKASLVAGGHTTHTPEVIANFIVVTREI